MDIIIKEKEIDKCNINILKLFYRTISLIIPYDNNDQCNYKVLILYIQNIDKESIPNIFNLEFDLEPFFEKYDQDKIYDIIKKWFLDFHNIYIGLLHIFHEPIAELIFDHLYNYKPHITTVIRRPLLSKIVINAKNPYNDINTYNPLFVHKPFQYNLIEYIHVEKIITYGMSNSLSIKYKNNTFIVYNPNKFNFFIKLAYQTLPITNLPRTFDISANLNEYGHDITTIIDTYKEFIEYLGPRINKNDIVFHIRNDSKVY
jgi:hypothetical protein